MSAWPGWAARRLACGVGVHRVAHRLHRDHLLIVMYHGVTDDPEQARRWWHHVHLSDFERQLRYLTQHYDIQPLDEALERLWSGALDRPTACITFDDGYRNNLTVALPALERFGAPATVYLATGMIGTASRLWTVELDHACSTMVLPTLDLACVGRSVLPTPDSVARRRAFDVLVAKLKQVSPSERARALDELFAQMGHTLGRVEDDGFAMMDWDEVRRMAGSPLVRFGGHTVNHEIVARLDSHALEREIRGSIETVTQNVASVSRTFAYPNGSASDFDARAVEAVRAAGCVAAVSTIEGLCRRDTDRFALKRIAVGNDTTLDQFRLLTSGLIPDLRALVARLKPRSEPRPDREPTRAVRETAASARR